MARQQRPETADGPHSVLTPNEIAMLWDRGFAVIPRDLFGRDPYAIADAIKRPGMAQQWGDKVHRADYVAQGWKIIKNDDWPGLFVPYQATSNTSNAEVEINGLILMQKPQHEVDRVHAANHAKADQNIEDWKARQEAAGFLVEIKESPRSPEFTNLHSAFGDQSGEFSADIVTVSGDESVLRTVQGAPTVDTTVGIPRDMMPHVGEILNERDRLCEDYANGRGVDDKIVLAYDEAIQKNPGAPKWPTLRAIVMPTAIENVRAKLQKGGSDAEKDSSTSHASGSTDRRDGPPAGDAQRPAGDDTAVHAGEPAVAAGGSDDSASPGPAAVDGSIPPPVKSGDGA